MWRLACISLIGFSLSLPVAEHLYAAGEEVSPPLTFVRQFATAQDVNSGPEPLLTQAVNAIAGPPEDPQHPPLLLQRPLAVTTDSSHRLYVTDISGAAVHVFDYLRSKYSVLKGGGPMRSPVGVAADRQGNVYVSDSTLRTVLIFDSKGKFSRYLKRPRGEESYFDGPHGIAIDPASGHIYVCDSPRQMVIVLDRKGGLVTRIGVRSGGSDKGEFRNPTQAAISRDEIAVLDSGNTRVQILDLRGHFRREIKVAYIDNQSGLAMDDDKNIYVSDPELNHLQVFAPDGHMLYDFGETGTKPGQFDHISGLWVDSGHCLYIADTNNRRVEEFRIGSGGVPGC